MSNRRSVILSGLAFGALGKVRAFDDVACAAPSSPMAARISLDGKIFEFNEADGRDLGDYEGPGFVQRCVMVTHPELPMTVFLRPDRESTRTEAVFELGRLWTGPPRHLGPYTAEILRGGQSLAKIDVPQHFWFSRWRWQSSRRPIVKTPAALIAAKLLPPFAVEANAANPSGHAGTPPGTSAPPAPSVSAASVGRGLPPPSTLAGPLRRGPNGDLELAPAREPKPAAPATAPAQDPTRRLTSTRIYTVMGLAGLTPYMPTTGDREEIGPVTEAQGRWIGTGSSDAVEEMFAQAEASGTIPWHMRDEKTGAPFNFNQYPRGGWNPGPAKMSDPYIPQLKAPVVPDVAHEPSLTYVPFIATGDPYYLEALQLQTTWSIGWHAPEYRKDDKCILPYWQTRAYAWTLRNLAQLSKACPETTPAWLLARRYWGTFLENNRVWFEENFVHKEDPPSRVFRVATIIRRSPDDPGIVGQLKIPRVDPWEEDYLAFVLGWVTMMFPEWRQAFSWKVGATIARTSGTSGWGRAYAVPYLLCLSGAPPAPWAQTWKEAWDTNVSLQGWKVADPEQFSQPKVNLGYLRYARAALALAARLGISDAPACFAWADQVVASRDSRIFYRWNVPA